MKILMTLGDGIMELINVECQNEIAVLKLNNGTTNALNLNFLKVISKNIHELKNNTSITGIVLTSENDKFFSIGFDLPHLYECNKDDVMTFYQAFNHLCMELYTFSKPIVAALTGHAIAGGCILALCCDYRFIADGRKLMGLNEIKLGLPVPYPADCVLRQLVGARIAQEIVYGGEFYQSVNLLNMGLVDRVLSLEQVIPESKEKAKLLGAMPHEAFSIIKRNRVEFVEVQILSKLAEKEQIFLKRWESDDTRELLKEAIKTFRK